MKIKLNIFVNRIDGKPLDDGPGTEPLKLSELLVRSLCNLQSQDAEEKFKCYMVATKIHEKDEADIALSDLELIKKSLNVYAPGVMGPIRMHLESL